MKIILTLPYHVIIWSVLKLSFFPNITYKHRDFRFISILQYRYGNVTLFFLLFRHAGVQVIVDFPFSLNNQQQIILIDQRVI